MSILQDAAQAVMGVAIRHAPQSWLPGGTPDPVSRKHGAVGAPVSRLDGRLKVTGQARFAAEVPLPGMVYAALAYSTIAQGRIASLDLDAARAAPGVALVMTHENAPRMAEPPVMMSSPKAAGQTGLPVMQDARIHWNGQPIALVLAATQEQADHAASLVAARYEPEPAVTAFAVAKASARSPGSIMGQPARVEMGDAEAALAAATHSVDLAFETPRHNHNAIEPHAVTVNWEADGTLVVHDASQLVTATAWTLAQIFGIAEDKVRVLSPYVGGGFGGKCLWDHQILAAAASRLAGLPVRLRLSREGVYRVVGGRTNSEQRVALGADADGRLVSLIHTGVVAMTTHNDVAEQFTFPARHLYASPAILLEQEVADMNMLANTFMRAPGEAIGTFALECALDELAERVGLDPIELRRRNEPARDPSSGLEFSSRHLLEAYELGAAAFGWEPGPRVPGARREGEWRIGTGFAVGTYPYYRMPGGSARIRIDADGIVTVSTAAQEMGMGTATVQSQVVAERMGVPLDRVRFEYGDSALPDSTVAGGSSQTVAVGAAVSAAHDALVAALLKLAGNDSPLAGLAREAVECRDGGLFALDDPSRGESYASILSRAGRDHAEATAAGPPPLELMRWSMHSYCAHFCEVRVSAVTGEVRVSRFLGAFDCGRILNAKTAASQFRGGIVMGLGLALTEETLFDERTGRVMNPSLAEYHVPVHLDVPEIEVLWTDIADPHAPMGAHGIGEIGITGVGAAVANAIHDATGRRMRALPMTPDRVM